MKETTVFLVALLDETHEEKKKVFAAVESVIQSEFFAAAQSDFKSQYKISLWVSDYEGQPFVEVDGIRYSVYRTYIRKDEKIELYLTDKIGVQ